MNKLCLSSLFLMSFVGTCFANKLFIDNDSGRDQAVYVTYKGGNIPKKPVLVWKTCQGCSNLMSENDAWTFHRNFIMYGIESITVEGHTIYVPSDEPFRGITSNDCLRLKIPVGFPNKPLRLERANC